jgi:hypothetical protein
VSRGKRVQRRRRGNQAALDLQFSRLCEDCPSLLPFSLFSTASCFVSRGWLLSASTAVLRALLVPRVVRRRRTVSSDRPLSSENDDALPSFSIPRLANPTPSFALPLAATAQRYSLDRSEGRLGGKSRLESARFAAFLVALDSRRSFSDSRYDDT